MQRLEGSPQYYSWGSTTAIPKFLNCESTGEPIAEMWFGAHPRGSSMVGDASLNEIIAANPTQELGPSVRYAFGDQLPYLMKLIAPQAPLSLQVHPSKAQAQAGFLAEDRAGIPIDSPVRTYRDSNHKPELLYALTHFEAFVGFTVRRRVRELLEGLDVSLARKIIRRLLLSTGRGMRPVLTWLLSPEDGPSPEKVDAFVAACKARLDSGDSPDPLRDRMIADLGQQCPGDPAVAAAFLMNPVVLEAGEALYLSPGTLHSYQSGFAIEVMANSDNVIRAGLTTKHVEHDELLELGNFETFPPVRLAAERPAQTIMRFAPPVEDFELTIADIEDSRSPLPGAGPRIILALAGELTVSSQNGQESLRSGEALFVSDADGPLLFTGMGQIAQTSVP